MTRSRAALMIRFSLLRLASDGGHAMPRTSRTSARSPGRTSSGYCRQTDSIAVAIRLPKELRGVKAFYPNPGGTCEVEMRLDKLVLWQSVTERGSRFAS